MDQQENPGEGSQPHDQSTNPRGQQNPTDRQSQNPDREPAEGARQEMPGPQQPTEGGRGSSTERNQGGGITNRGMDRELEEQEQLPPRGSDESER